MRPPPRKYSRENAKGPAEIRPSSGMSPWAALASLGAICALSGCFEVNYGDCRVTCTVAQGCPANLVCVMERGSGLCAPHGTMTCYPGQPKDAAPDGSNAGDAG